MKKRADFKHYKRIGGKLIYLKQKQKKLADFLKMFSKNGVPLACN